MGVNVFDEFGKLYFVGEVFSNETVEQPLVTERREVYSFPFGNAEIVQLAFSGIYIVYGDMLLYKAQKLNFEITGDIDLVEMHFSLAGDGRMKNLLTGKEFHFKANEHNLHYTPSFTGTGEYGSTKHYKFFEVHFTKRFFIELAKDSSPSLMQFAEKIAKGKENDLSRENMPITFAMHQCINDIMHANFTGGLKLLYLQSKCIELLSMQAQMHEDAASKAASLICKPGHDTDSIHFAKEYLLQHAAQPPSLTELAKIAGINEFKLKQGFKALYNNTVFGYLSDYKLNQARDLLVSKSSIKEVADQLGYSSVQHFNSAFRKKFGLPPGKVKKG
ncbi:helix-turn-helix transcriptional regulator [Niastella caeni]|uniref:Helix-turn-helix transcriptional regulator n=1 Tax=Niastella caeni TaxID=2569763 RepID=A0A4S8HXJ4_9BACT|nr:AraC family transcriptional regulator [Niastella caeni]THU40443.1 helix-turn-helix transcriptional regulator [Niastella caeni]